MAATTTVIPLRTLVPRLVLGTGTGRCGTHSLADVLDQQPSANVTHEQRPLLPWRLRAGAPGIAERLQRLRRSRAAEFVGDVASFYLPYVEQAIQLEPDIRIICLERPREEVVESFCRWLDRVHPLPTDHWSQVPAPGWHHDPIWTRIFPQFDVRDRVEGIRRYWDEYARTAADLARRLPVNFRVFPTEETLNSERGLRRLLTFAGFPEERQVIPVSARRARSETERPHPRRAIATQCGPNDPRRCIILVVHAAPIASECDAVLRTLHTRGYAVLRIPCDGAVERVRNQVVASVLGNGFQETIWINPRVRFSPDDIERLRSHGESIVAGVYPLPGNQGPSCQVLPGTRTMTLGKGGGLQEVMYASAGFLLVRRPVYMDIQRQLDLPVCDEPTGGVAIPFFLTSPVPHNDGYRLLPDDYAFCERARQCGHRVFADTSISLPYANS